MDATASNAEQTVAERLAARICAFGWTDVTRQALARARMAFIDTIGVTLGGVNEACTTALLRTPGIATAPGASLLFGTDRRTSALDAVLVNGTASHAQDYDDFSSVLGGHQSVPLVPLLFALGEERKLTGRQVLAAYVIGVEVESRIARGVHFHHYDKGWHPTATIGVFGAAAAAAHVLGLDETRTATALAIATSFASGLKANFGTMMKPLHVGHCGRSGLFAALLAEAGYDANLSAFEHHQGFLNVFNGPGTFDIERIFAGWAAPLEIEQPTIVLKRYPCCGSAHPAIAMALALARDEGVRADDIAQLDVLPHGRRLRHTNNPDPRTPLEAKFSVQYAVARAFVDGAVRLKHFEGDAALDPRVRTLLAVCQARPHPDMADDSPDQWGAEVIATLKDGRVVSRRVNDLLHESNGELMSASELWDKFEDCAGRALPRVQIAPLFERLETLDSVDDMSSVARLLEVTSLSGARPQGTAPNRQAAPADSDTFETTWVP